MPPARLTSDCTRPALISGVLGGIVQGAILGGAIGVAVLAAFAAPALALSKDAAVENCRATIGKPFVQACVRGMGGRNSGDFEANLASCRAQITPKVRA